jgi:hypothetical protein
MKLFLIILVSLVLLISGCVTPQTEKSPNASEKTKVTNSPLKSPLATQQKIQENLQSTSPSAQTPATTQQPDPSRSVEDISTQAYDNYPSISGSLSPSNPGLGDVFKLTIDSKDVEGIKQISWESIKPLSGSSSGSFECNLQKTCSNIWNLTAGEQGKYEIDVVVKDSSDKEGKLALNLDVGPAVVRKSPSPTPTQSTQVSASPQSTATSGCTSNSDCGYKQKCSSGKCVDVQCTTDSQCTGCKRCSSNSCVSCGSGPYGCYC